jgi:hypothetical protein
MSPKGIFRVLKRLKISRVDTSGETEWTVWSERCGHFAKKEVATFGITPTIAYRPHFDGTENYHLHRLLYLRGQKEIDAAMPEPICFV